jgi:predicted MPP superfamily phosphohydrolase
MPDFPLNPQWSMISVRLDMNVAEFEGERERFIAEFAELVGTTPEEVRIIRVDRGCVVPIMMIPIENLQEFKRRIIAGEYDDAIEAFFQRWKSKIKHVRFDDEVEAAYVNFLSEMKEPHEALTWLHISDLHMRADGGSKQWTQQATLDEFLRDLPQRLSEWNLRPDYLFFTGDISFSGHQEEYDQVHLFIQELMNRLPKRPALFMVPGNHDITWSAVDTAQEKRVRKHVNETDRVSSLLLDKDKATAAMRDYVFLRQKSFFEFTQLVTDFGQPITTEQSYFFSTTQLHRGVNLGIAGLNSSWLSTAKKKKGGNDLDPDLGRLALGEHQIQTSGNALSNADIKIALLHHPPMSDWFREFDQETQSELLTDFDFVLRGHEHRRAVFCVSQPMIDKSWIHIASSALYDHPRRPNGFNVVRIDLERAKAQLFLWCYIKERRSWRHDPSYGTEGFLKLNLHRNLQERILSAGNEWAAKMQALGKGFWDKYSTQFAPVGLALSDFDGVFSELLSTGLTSEEATLALYSFLVAYISPNESTRRLADVLNIQLGPQRIKQNGMLTCLKEAIGKVQRNGTAQQAFWGREELFAKIAVSGAT